VVPHKISAVLSGGVWSADEIGGVAARIAAAIAIPMCFAILMVAPYDVL
ncbi:MAG: hypothetical protein HY239_20935, partial [Mycolicibacterium aromaticivorans]|nr:hypothetical protein [Mycolicibacterium aromaticivorans]